MLPGRTLRRHGFSLLELIVLLGLLLFFLAIAIPLIFRFWAQGEQQRGQNNLRQIAIAMHAYHDTSKTFPPGVGRIRGIEGSLLFHLLPYVEQAPIYNKGPVWQAGTVNVRLAIYLDPRDKSAPPDNLFDGWLATSNYAGSWPVFKNGQNNFANITDGTSNTFAFTERFQVCNNHPCAWGYDRLYYWAPVFAYYSPAKFQVLPAASECDPALPQALDRAGIQVAMCDGSARIIAPRISPQTWHHLVTPDGGEVIGGDFND